VVTPTTKSVAVSTTCPVIFVSAIYFFLVIYGHNLI